MKKATAILVATALFLLCFSSVSAFRPPSSKAMKGAYWPSWVNSRLPPSTIDSTLFTHIYYASLVPNATTFKFDVDDSTGQLLTTFTSALHSKKPPLKALFSVSGEGAGPSVFSQMASSQSSRRSFILSSIEVARKYGFDGVDLDWEFPQNPKEMTDLGTLFDEWRVEIVRESKQTRRPRTQLLLTAAVYFSASFFLSDTVRTYPVASINKNLDWVNVMCYDYHGSWDTTATASQSALTDPKSNISTSYGLWSWIKQGILRNKLVMGLPLYGRTWTLKDAHVSGVGAPAVGVGPNGASGERGVMLYYEVEEFNRKNNSKIGFDLATMSTYSVAGTAWIGYDDTRSTAARIGFAQSLGIRGYFFWALSYDEDWRISRSASNMWR